MFDPYLPMYDQYRSIIRNYRHNMIWEEIKKKGTEERIKGWFDDHQVNTILTPEEWCLIVDKMVESEQGELFSIENGKKGQDDAIVGPEVSSDVVLGTDDSSSWGQYSKHLLKKDWFQGSVNLLGESTLQILKRMKRDTWGKSSLKGLVVGHVQSGKTASMAGLMAAGADNGYNFYIILTGTIENLRKQTSERLFKDLQHPGNLHWNELSHLGSNKEPGHQLANLQFQQGSSERYFTVCLKNKTRLENLVKWLNYPPKLEQMKVVIIDDEADQASINTSMKPEQRTIINKKIIELTNVKAQAVNYVAYTATPYSCFLNESFDESLYPRDFIKMLPQSTEHFGSEQIFGIPGEKTDLGIIRRIYSFDDESSQKHGNCTCGDPDMDELVQIKMIHDGTCLELPESLKDAIAWFVCCVATRRFTEAEIPVSMLIHTSQKQSHHKNMQEAVQNWLINTTEVSDRCKNVWNSETNMFTKEILAERYKEYRLLEQISDYPSYLMLESLVNEILREITYIYLNEDDKPKYTKGIHLCIDNSSMNGIDDEGKHLRLLYPKDYENKENGTLYAPAFLVIGGNTLSRGLTLEGLVSTYFLRNSTTADTLMQMGRWFGYRKNYELLPRIWMTAKTQESFEYLADLEKDLRQELVNFQNDLRSPAEFGPRVKCLPQFIKIAVTARNKMKNAIPCEFDFTGFNKQTTLFEQDMIVQNLNTTNDFLKSLPQCESGMKKTQLVWCNVPFETVRKYLTLMKFHKDLTGFSNLEPLLEWYKAVQEPEKYGPWNIVLAGNEEDKYGTWESHKINYVHRSADTKKRDDAYYIKVVRNPQDLYADIPETKRSDLPKIISNKHVNQERHKKGMDYIPQLLIYGVKIDNVTTPLVALSIWIPSITPDDKVNEFVKALTVKLENTVFDEPEGE